MNTKRIEQLCVEFDVRVDEVGVHFARLEWAKWLAELEGENERLQEALDQIAESQDRGRYDGQPEPGPAYDEPYTPWLIARQALSAETNADEH